MLEKSRSYVDLWWQKTIWNLGIMSNAQIIFAHFFLQLLQVLWKDTSQYILEQLRPCYIFYCKLGWNIYFWIPIYLPCPKVTEWESLCWHLKKFLHVIPFCRNAMRYLVSGFATLCSQYTFNYNVYLKLNVVGRIIAFHRCPCPNSWNLCIC